MNPGDAIPYADLAAFAERLFEESGDDDEQLGALLDHVPEEIRDQLLISDILNAYQVFYYFFRVGPDEEVMERLMLEPASLLRQGVFLEEYDLLEIFFRVGEEGPVIEISDGERVLASFTGHGAYREALAFAGTSL